MHPIALVIAGVGVPSYGIAVVVAGAVGAWLVEGLGRTVLDRLRGEASAGACGLLLSSWFGLLMAVASLGFLGWAVRRG